MINLPTYPSANKNPTSHLKGDAILHPSDYELLKSTSHKLFTEIASSLGNNSNRLPTSTSFVNLPVQSNTVHDILKGELDSDETEDAFYVADLGEVSRQHVLWKKLLPRLEPFYAVKCNPDPMVLARLASHGTGFDCASKAEIQMALDQGVSPDNIIYANPCKQASHIKFAAANGVRKMTFDNADELVKIKQFHPEAQLIVRILTDDSRSICKLGTKFGACPSVVPSLLATARDLELEMIGVSFHVGSGCFDASAFGEAVALAKQIFDLGSEYGFKFTVLDVGGGFPGQDASGVTFEEIAAILGPAVDRLFAPDVRVIAEPGRYFVSSAYTLAVNVVARRSLPSAAQGSNAYMYYINDGMYGSFNCITFDHAIVTPCVLMKGGVFEYPTEGHSAAAAAAGVEASPSPSSSKASDVMSDSASSSSASTSGEDEGLVPNGPPHYPASVWGPTCDSIDCIGKNFSLPVMSVGDWMYFANMGAYTMCAASQFNGFKKSGIIYTDTFASSPRA